MDPYAKPNERKTGAKKPKIVHLPGATDTRTKSQRDADKQAVKDERRAIKHSARQHLRRQLRSALDEISP